MATPDKVTYVWTNLDKLVIDNSKSKTACSGTGTQCVSKDGQHVCHVTPYGLLLGLDQKFSTLNAGDTIDLAADVDALVGRSHEQWRVTRYHTSMKGLQWYEVSYPESITTLGALVDHLVAKKDEYPPEKYGKPGAPNKAMLQLIFDYWRNSALRSRVADTHKAWITEYSSSPEKLPVRVDEKGKPSVRITHVPRAVIVVAPKAAAPSANPADLLGGFQKCLTDGGDAKIDAYIKELDELTGELDALQKASNDAEKERLGLIARLHAVKVIAEQQDAVLTKTANGEGAAVASSVDAVLPKARTALRSVPVMTTYSDKGVAESIERYLRTGHPRTRNVASDVKTACTELRALLFGSQHRELIEAWCKCNAHAYSSNDARTVTRVGALCYAMGRAMRWLGEAGPASGTGQTSDADSLVAVLDRAPSDRAKSGSDVKGTFPLELVLSMVGKEFDEDEQSFEIIGMAGKGSAIATQVVGNLAGPPSLSIALIEGYQTWKFTKLATAAKDQSKAGGTFQAEAWHRFAEEVVDRIPGRKLREEVRQALIDKDDDALEALKKKVAGQHASGAQSSATWKGAICILNIVNAAMTLYEAANDPPDTMIEQFTFAANVISGGMVVVLGSIELYLQVAGDLNTATVDMLGRLNCVAGLLTCIAGICTGIVNLVDAAKDGDKQAVASAALAIAGNALMAYVCLVGIFGSTPAGWPVAALAIVCLLASQALTLKDLGKTDCNIVCEGFVKWVRKDPIFQAAESQDSELAAAMKQLEIDCVKRYLPGVEHEESVYAKLRLAGLSEPLIDMVKSKRVA